MSVVGSTSLLRTTSALYSQSAASSPTTTVFLTEHRNIPLAVYGTRSVATLRLEARFNTHPRRADGTPNYFPVNSHSDASIDHARGPSSVVVDPATSISADWNTSFYQSQPPIYLLPSRKCLKTPLPPHGPPPIIELLQRSVNVGVY